MVRVKVCGVTNLRDGLLAAELGAEWVGFVLAESPRRVDVEVGRAVSLALPPQVNRVGVFVNEKERVVKEIATYLQLDFLQFHGSESPSYCRRFKQKVIKTFRVQSGLDLSILPQYQVAAFLLDTFEKGKPGGTGKTFDWRVAREAKKYGRVILSGGLNSGNVAQAIRSVQPYGVDVSSGVEEKPGKKDPQKMKAFFESVRKVGSG